MKEKDISGLVMRYEQMLAEGRSVYFDAEEFDSLAEYYDLLDDVEMAEDVVEQGLSIHPNNHQLTLKKIKFMIYKGSYFKALEMLNSSFNGYDLDLYLMKIDCFLQMGRFAEALAITTEAIDNETEELDVLYSELGFLYIENDHFKEAISYFESCLLYDPSNEEVLTELAYAYEMESDFLSAVRVCNLLLDINPYSHEVWVNLGRLYSLLEEYDKAVDAFEFASTTGVADKNVLKLKAHCLSLCERIPEAIEVFKEYLEENSDDESVLYSLAECYFTLEQYDDMLEFLDRCEKVKGEDTIDIIAKKAFAYLQKDDHKKVSQLIEQGLNIAPDNEDLNIVAGEYYFRLDNYLLSECFFSNAYYSGNRKNKTLLDRLSAICIAKGDIDQSIVYMEELARLDNDLQTRTRLALLYFESGDKKRFNSYIDLFSDDDLRHLVSLFFSREQFNVETMIRKSLIDRLNDAWECRQLFKNIMY